ncbi:hypothetical protein C8Q80DRAFT_182672 [Daedaleopsis nitida]|nr:hypothetical protein C8Q80DRAFT_182672 [Daedaleopsis nitida]
MLVLTQNTYASSTSSNATYKKDKGKGAVYVGQTALAKSYFMIYALLRRMATGQTTLFSTTQGQTSYLFDEQGRMAHAKEGHHSRSNSRCRL